MSEWKRVDTSEASFPNRREERNYGNGLEAVVGVSASGAAYHRVTFDGDVVMSTSIQIPYGVDVDGPEAAACIEERKTYAERAAAYLQKFAAEYESRRRS